MRHSSRVKVAHVAVHLLLSAVVIQGLTQQGFAQNAPGTQHRAPSTSAVVPTVSLALCVGQVAASRPYTEVFKSEFTHLKGEHASDEFGVAVASGDIDHDGYTDIVVGARGDVVTGDSKGMVYIYKGSKTGVATVPTLVLQGEQSKGEFGRTLIAGDINSDGYADVIVGSHGFNAGEGTHQGKVFIYLGGPKGIDSTPSQTLLGEVKGSEFGRVFDIVDMNKDGINDLLISASGFSGEFRNQGKAYVYLGTRSGINPKPYFTAVGEKENDEFARSIAGADVNGDGMTDLIVGASGGTGGNASKNTVPGTLYVFYATVKGLIEPFNAKFEGEFPKGHLGEGLSAVGDINHDGYADVAIGARDYACGNGVAGKVYAYLGGPAGLSSNRLWTAIGIGSGGVGRSMAPAGDVDGDGFEDFLSGAPVGTVAKGAGVYVFFGGATGWGSNPVIVNANDGENAIGFGVFSGGDVNGDGAPDIVVGARDGGESKQGWARVYYGKKGSVAIKR